MKSKLISSMTGRAVVGGFLAVECLVIFTLLGGPARAAEQKFLSGQVPTVVSRLTATGVLPASTHLHLAIGLPVRNQVAMDALLQQIYDPASPNYRHFLTPEQFAENFGPSHEDYQSVVDFARTNGLTVTSFYSNRMVLNVDGDVPQIEEAFHIILREYKHPTEARAFFAPDVAPSVAVGLPISHVQGLDNYVLPRPLLQKMPASAVRPSAGSAPGGGYMGKDFRNAYLPGGKLDGSGQIVGLLQFDGYDPNDIATYKTVAGLPDVPLQNILLDGFDGTPGAANDEVCLDIETSISMAPGLTKVVVFEGSLPNSILSSMVSHPEIKQFSASWGYDIDSTSEQLYKQMALQGQTFLNASGDGDAWVGDVYYPCLEDTNLTLVGGTTLTMSGNGVAYVSEKAWNWGFVGDYNWNPDGYFGTSGGISTHIGIPGWQQGIDMTASKGSTSMRNMPDVALTADNIYVVYDSGSTGGFGGTSCASPLWAGFMALINQQAAINGNPPVGFLAPQVYAIAKTASYTNCFHDTITGDNTWPQSPDKFFAVSGYDLCTGLGTPNGTALIDQLAGKAPRTGFLQLTIDPSSGSTLLNASTQKVFVAVNDGGYGVTNAIVTVVIPGVTNLTLLDDGQPPDVAANDAVYSAAFQVPSSISALTMTVAASATNTVGVTNTVNYSVVPLPPNDNFANATKIPAGGGTYLANNYFATIEPNEPFQDGVSSRTASLWWQWTPNTTTNVFIDTTGSKVNNVLAVYTGSALTTLQPLVATNGVAAQFKPAHVSFNAQAGTTYRISVASTSSNSLGSLVLHVTPGGQMDTNPPVVSVVSPLSGQTVSSSSIVISGTATDPLPNSSGVGRISVYVNGALIIATGTTNWSVPVALQPEQNVVRVNAVDEAGNVSSTVTLDINYLVPTVANDFFANAAALNGTSGSVSGGNTNATREAGEPYIAANSGGKSVWWSFTPTVDGVLTLNTTNSNFDTLLGLYTGPDVADLTAIADNDDAYAGAPGGFSFLSQAVRAHQTYDIAVDGYGGVSGTVVLSYVFAPGTVYQLSVEDTSGGSVQLTITNSLGGTTELPGLSADFAAGTVVTLSATPYANGQFDHWSGGITSSNNPLILVVQSNLNLTANFGPPSFTDGFESGDLSHLTWTTMGSAPWFVQTNTVAQGQYAARSGSITNSQTSSLVLTTNFIAGIGSFDFKVSSELNWDFLKFYVDGVLYKQWSGEVSWANYTFALNAGQHTLTWSYVKDPSGSSGMDAVFLDDVDLPIVPPVAPQPPQLQLQLQNGDSLQLTLTGQADGQYVIQNSTNLVDWQSFSTNVATGGVIQIPLPFSVTNQTQFYRAFAP